MSAALPNMPKVSSRMTGKLEGIHAINTNTVTNDFAISKRKPTRYAVSAIRTIC